MPRAGSLIGLLLAFAVVRAALCGRDWRFPRVTAAALAVFCGLGLVSVAWSVHPRGTLERAVGEVVVLAALGLLAGCVASRPSLGDGMLDGVLAAARSSRSPASSTGSSSRRVRRSPRRPSTRRATRGSSRTRTRRRCCSRLGCRSRSGARSPRGPALRVWPSCCSWPSSPRRSARRVRAVGSRRASSRCSSSSRSRRFGAASAPASRRSSSRGSSSRRGR